MATINWGLPTQTSLYTDVLTLIDSRLKNVAMQFPTSDTYTSLPTNTISFRSSKWQYWNGASWIDLRNYSAATPEYYDIGIIGTASNIRGVAAAVNGGTGKSSYTVGDILTATSTTALSAITPSVYGKVLLSQGSGTASAPTWGQVNLEDHVTGILPVTHGGTGVNTIIGILKGNGTNDFTAAVAGTDYAAAIHTHSYVPLAGGTMTGGLTIGTSSAGANADIYGDITTYSSIIIKNISPTIRLQDADNRTAFIHVNSNYFHILRGAVNGTTWDNGPNNRHPMTLDIDTTGSVTFSGNVTAYSDIRLKTNIEPIKNALADTCKLTGVTFDRLDSAIKGIGVIAQEVQKVCPRAVEEDKDGYLSVAYGNLVGLLIEAIKELNAKVEKLENAR